MTHETDKVYVVCSGAPSLKTLENIGNKNRGEGGGKGKRAGAPGSDNSDDGDASNADEGDSHWPQQKTTRKKTRGEWVDPRTGARGTPNGSVFFVSGVV